MRNAVLPWHKYCCLGMLAGKFTGGKVVLMPLFLLPERQDPIRFAGNLMLKHYVIFAVAFAASLPLTGAFAATSIPMPEAGFALASNNGGAESIAPMSSDMAGGTTRVNRVADIAANEPSSNVAPVTSGNATVRDDHAGKGTPTDGSVPANSTSTSHKSRGNAHWQSLLPGLMK